MTPFKNGDTMKLNELSDHHPSPATLPSGVPTQVVGTCSGLLLGLALTVAVPSGNLSAADFRMLVSASSYSSELGMPLVTVSGTATNAAAPMVAEVVAALSLTTTQIAKALRVSRQRIYDYRNGEEAGAETLERLQVLARLAQHWSARAAGTLSGKIALPFADGVSILSMLEAPAIDEAEVRARLSQVAEFQRGHAASPFRPRPSAIDELRAMGVSEPTEDEKYLRNEDERTRRWLHKIDRRG